MKIVKLVVITCLIAFSLAIREFKEPKCAKGWKQNSVKITTNGCGPQGKGLGTKMLEEFLKAAGPEFKKCCDVHDECFSTCRFTNSHFNKCNDDFYSCMKAACKAKNPSENVDETPVDESKAQSLLKSLTSFGNKLNRGQCIVRAKIFRAAVSGSIGEGVYQSSQKEHCQECPKRFF